MNGSSRARRLLPYVIAVLIVVGMSVLRACDPPRETEIIVKLKEEGKRLTTERRGDETVLFYGDEELTILDALPGIDREDISQSLPQFSTRWQREREWRMGHLDTLGLTALANRVDDCGLDPSYYNAIRAIIMRWQGDRTVAQARPGAMQALDKLVSGALLSTADSLAVEDILPELQLDGQVIGQLDTLAVPAIEHLLMTCAVAVGEDDSLAILSFVRRIQEDGGIGGLDELAIPAILSVVRRERSFTLRESLAAASFIRLLAGRSAPDRQDTLPSVDLYLRIRVRGRANIDELIDLIESIPEVDYARPAIPDALAPPDCDDAESLDQFEQSYLDGDGSINARFAWERGGTGKEVRVFVCEMSFWDGHDALQSIEIRTLSDHPPAGESTTTARHGTMTLAMLAARNDPGGLEGICHKAEFVFSTTLQDDEAQSDGSSCCGGSKKRTASAVRLAIDKVLGDQALKRGDVIVIEADQDLAKFKEQVSASAAAGEYPNALPVEVNEDVLVAIKTAVQEFGVIVVQAAGNGSGKLEPIVFDGETYWDPADDSGAIIVGAGRAALDGVSNPHVRIAASNHGQRVDCQGWGEKVATATFCVGGEGTRVSKYTPNYSNTSSATAMVAGVVACFQSAYKEGNNDMPISPDWLRAHIREKDYGSFADEPLQERIGPLPDLKKLIDAFELGS